MTQTYPIHPSLDRIQKPALLVGVIGLILALLSLFITPAHQFFLSYLFAYLFWLGIPLGCTAILMLQHLTGGAWALPLRRLLEAAMRMIPFMALLFIPILFSLGSLYPWSDPTTRAHLAPLQQDYLTPGLFILRTFIYFAIWITLAFLLDRWSVEQDRTGHPTLIRRFQFLSAPGLILYVLTVTFAAIDWIMSIDPHWFSSIWGFLFVIGQALSALAFVIVLAAWLASRTPLANLLSRDTLQDIGNLLLAFTMLWAYISFSQLLIIWSGNIEHETPYYLYRVAGGWKVLAAILIVVHFAIPFALLLSRWTKRRLAILASVAALLVVMRLFDLFWTVAPMYPQGRHILPRPGFHIHWLDFIFPIAFGGIWIALFIWQLKRRPLLPIHDPRLHEVSQHDAHSASGPPQRAPGTA